MTDPPAPEPKLFHFYSLHLPLHQALSAELIAAFQPANYLPYQLLL